MKISNKLLMLTMLISTAVAAQMFIILGWVLLPLIIAGIPWTLWIIKNRKKE